MADSYYKLPDDPQYRTEIRELQDTDPVRAETIVNPLIENILENVHAVKKEGDRHKESTDHDGRYYTQDQVDNKFSTLETNIDWKESVDTYADIAVKYPDPDDGWTVNVKDTDYTYRWTGNEWVAISANAIPLATQDVDGKMSKEYAAKLDGVADNANNYTHPDSGVAAGTYRSVTVNQTGHVTAGTNPTVTVEQGGTGATTAAEARTNLGVPPTSHASTATTYGVGTASNYGHAMASSATPLVAGTANAGTDNGKYAREGHVHPVQTSVTGTAGSANTLTTARNIALTGDVTGSVAFNGSANVNIASTLANSGVTAGSYGPTAAVSPGAGGAFNVPQVTVDAKGRATSVANRAVTLPAAYSHPTFTASTIGPSANATLAYGGTFVVPQVGRDANGHASTLTARTMTMPAAPTSVATLNTARGFSITGGATAAAVNFNGSANVVLNVTALNASALPNSGVTAATYGASATASPGYGGSFVVPAVTVNAKGLVTSAANRTITLPAAPTSVATLNTARYFSTTGAVTGTATAFNGSANVAIPTTALNVSYATAGTLPIARGGTGATTAAAALTALGAVAANMSPVNIGLNAAASGESSTALGIYARASQAYSTALGSYTEASGAYSIALGDIAVASGESSMALGGNAAASGSYSTAMGAFANARDIRSTAIGFNAITNGANAISAGDQARAATAGSVAIGSNAISNGTQGTAVGRNAFATGSYGVALGSLSTAGGNCSAAVGRNVSATGNYSIAFGYHANASGINSTALGFNATASGAGSIALGRDTIANNTSAVAVGYNTKATGNYSSSFGISATASGNYSTAIGRSAVASAANTIQLGNASTLSRLSCRVALSVTSDERDKIVIEETDKELEFINKLNPIIFYDNQREKYIDDENLTGEQKELKERYGLCEYDRDEHAKGTRKGDRKRIGLKAQEIVRALEEVYGSSDYANIVNDNFHDYEDVPEGVENQLQVSYSNFIPFLIGAVKELAVQNTSLLRQNKEISKRIRVLEERIHE